MMPASWAKVGALGLATMPVPVTGLYSPPSGSPWAKPPAVLPSGPEAPSEPLPSLPLDAVGSMVMPPE